MLERACGKLLRITTGSTSSTTRPITATATRSTVTPRGKLTGDDKQGGRRERGSRPPLDQRHRGARSRKLSKGVRAVYDLSATPFFLRGSGYPEGTLVSMGRLRFQPDRRHREEERGRGARSQSERPSAPAPWPVLDWSLDSATATEGPAPSESRLDLRVSRPEHQPQAVLIDGPIPIECSEERGNERKDFVVADAGVIPSHSELSGGEIA
jgi:hypothetical protein